MRQFIGHKLKVAVQEIGMIQGTLVNDQKDRIFLKGEDGKITRVIKSKICGFTPLDFEPHDYIPFHVLYCENKQTGCPGVKLIQEGDGVKRSDFPAFMEPCPCYCETCTYGTKGEIHTISGALLRELLANTMYGEYPVEADKEEKDDASSGTASGEVEHSEGGDSEGVAEEGEA